MDDRAPSRDPWHVAGWACVALGCLAWPGTPAPVALAPAAIALLALCLVPRRTPAGSAARTGRGLPAWQAGVVASHLAFRAAPALSAVSLGLECACAAGGAVLLPARAALAVAASIVALEATAAAWRVGLGEAISAEAAAGLPARLFAPLAVMGVTWYLSERQRRAQGRLESRLSRLAEEADASAGSEPAPAPLPVGGRGAASGRGAVFGRGADGASRPAASGAEDQGRVAGDLGGLLEVARRALKARTCVLFERDDDPPCWRVAAAASTADDFDGLATVPIGHGLIAWAAKHDVPFRLVEPGPQLRALPWYSGDSATASFLAVPLPHDGAGEAPDGPAASAVLACDSPVPRRFDPEAEDLVQLHAAEVASRLAGVRRLAVLAFEREATRVLPSAVAAVTQQRGVTAVARALLDRARAISGAASGAVLVAEGGTLPPAAAAEPGETNAAAARLSVAAFAGLDAEADIDAGADGETWATWAARHPEAPVRLAAYAADRGMPRIVRGDGLDAASSFAAFALAAPGGSAGSLALAWSSRRLPGAAVLEALDVLAQAGAAALSREQAEARLAVGRALDGLTGLPGRTALHHRGAEAFAAARAGRARLSVAWFDLDGSAQLNLRDPGTWDLAVEALGRTLVAALPSLARVHRWSGDAFVALLPGTGEEGVLVAARRATAAVAQGVLAGKRMTACAGVATLGDEDASFEALLARAGEALHAAKASGPGKVRVAPA